MIEHKGVWYMTGSAGSIIMACPKCGEEHFRGHEVLPGAFGRGPYGNCWTCRDVPMELQRFDELDSKWYPLWHSLGHKIRPYGPVRPEDWP